MIMEIGRYSCYNENLFYGWRGTMAKLFDRLSTMLKVLIIIALAFLIVLGLYGLKSLIINGRIVP